MPSLPQRDLPFDADVAASRAGRPIVLLHGFAGSPAVMRPLAHALGRRLGRPVLRLAISPGAQDLRESAAELYAALVRLVGRPGRDFVDLVGHSMGGLVATWLLKKLDQGRLVRSVVTLGTPHRGTPWAYAGALLFDRLPALRQMCPGSEFVRELLSLPVPRACELVSVAGASDQIVSPEYAALASRCGERNLLADRAGHASLLVSRAVYRLVGQALLGGPGRGDGTRTLAPASTFAALPAGA